MPTYEYVCPEGHTFDLFQKMSDPVEGRCPTCGRPATRKISGGAGLVFKGSGFYITDYGKDGKGPRKDPKEGAPASGGTESKPAKTEAAAGTPPAPAKPVESKSPKPPKAAE